MMVRNIANYNQLIDIKEKAKKHTKNGIKYGREMMSEKRIERRKKKIRRERKEFLISTHTKLVIWLMMQQISLQDFSSCLCIGRKILCSFLPKKKQINKFFFLHHHNRLHFDDLWNHDFIRFSHSHFTHNSLLYTSMMVFLVKRNFFLLFHLYLSSSGKQNNGWTRTSKWVWDE